MAQQQQLALPPLFSFTVKRATSFPRLSNQKPLATATHATLIHHSIPSPRIQAPSIAFPVPGAQLETGGVPRRGCRRRSGDQEASGLADGDVEGLRRAATGTGGLRCSSVGACAAAASGCRSIGGGNGGAWGARRHGASRGHRRLQRGVAACSPAPPPEHFRQGPCPPSPPAVAPSSPPAPRPAPGHAGSLQLTVPRHRRRRNASPSTSLPPPSRRPSSSSLEAFLRRRGHPRRRHAARRRRSQEPDARRCLRQGAGQGPVDRVHAAGRAGAGGGSAGLGRVPVRAAHHGVLRRRVHAGAVPRPGSGGGAGADGGEGLALWLLSRR
uniref:Uncharacterized protein n=1 Tax=Setaria italica TaxID=4555 RepID=K3Z7Y8_SETIT